MMGMYRMTAPRVHIKDYDIARVYILLYTFSFLLRKKKLNLEGQIDTVERRHAPLAAHRHACSHVATSYIINSTASRPY